MEKIKSAPTPPQPSGRSPSNRSHLEAVPEKGLAIGQRSTSKKPRDLGELYQEP